MWTWVYVTFDGTVEPATVHGHHDPVSGDVHWATLVETPMFSVHEWIDDGIYMPEMIQYVIQIHERLTV